MHIHALTHSRLLVTQLENLNRNRIWTPFSGSVRRLIKIRPDPSNALLFCVTFGARCISSKPAFRFRILAVVVVGGRWSVFLAVGERAEKRAFFQNNKTTKQYTCEMRASDAWKTSRVNYAFRYRIRQNRGQAQGGARVRRAFPFALPLRWHGSSSTGAIIIIVPKPASTLFREMLNLFAKPNHNSVMCA